MEQVTYVIDIETWKSKKFAFGILWKNFKDFEIFFSPDSFRNKILSLAKKDFHSPKILFLGHNISYDLNWIFGNIEIFFSPAYIIEGKNHKKRYWKNILNRDGRFYYAQYYNLNFKDTFNLCYNQSLKELGKILGYEKIETPDKFLKDEIGTIDNMDIAYCERDCEICFLWFQKIKDFVESHNGKLGLTIASSGLSILKNFEGSEINDMLKSIIKNFKLTELDEKFRDSYYGGRTEVYKKNIFDGFYYDVNSLYPFVMTFNGFPDVRTLRKFNGEIQTALDSYEGCWKGTIHVPEMEIAPLPFRTDEGKINYPTGTFSGCWNFPEIRTALSVGCSIIETEQIIIANRIVSPFKDYCLFMYDLRKTYKQNNDSTEQIVKLFMNSVYGKFAQRSYENKIIPLNDYEGFCKVIEYNGIKYARVETPKIRSKCDILCLSSYVTCYARTVLYQYLISCSNVCYCDTDSIITKTELPTGKELGQMKLEHTIRFGSFKNRKDYYIDIGDRAVLKRKGVSLKNVIGFDKDLILEGNKKELLKIHNMDELSYERIVKTREELLSKQGKKASHLFVQEKVRIKQEDDGRVWIKNDSVPVQVLTQKAE